MLCKVFVKYQIWPADSVQTSTCHSCSDLHCWRPRSRRSRQLQKLLLVLVVFLFLALAASFSTILSGWLKKRRRLWTGLDPEAALGLRRSRWRQWWSSKVMIWLPAALLADWQPSRQVAKCIAMRSPGLQSTQQTGQGELAGRASHFAHLHGCTLELGST